MASAFEKTVSATEFKATCLDLIDQLGTGKLQRVHITKRGRPLLTLAPQAARRPSDALFGGMKGKIAVPPGLDLTSPVIPTIEVEAMRDWTPD